MLKTAFPACLLLLLSIHWIVVHKVGSVRVTITCLRALTFQCVHLGHPLVRLSQCVDPGHPFVRLSQCAHLGHPFVRLCQCAHLGHPFVRLCQCAHLGHPFVRLCQCAHLGHPFVRLCQCVHLGHPFVRLSQCFVLIVISINLVHRKERGYVSLSLSDCQCLYAQRPVRQRDMYCTALHKTDGYWCRGHVTITHTSGAGAVEWEWGGD